MRAHGSFHYEISASFSSDSLAACSFVMVQTWMVPGPRMFREHGSFSRTALKWHGTNLFVAWGDTGRWGKTRTYCRRSQELLHNKHIFTILHVFRTDQLALPAEAIAWPAFAVGLFRRGPPQLRGDSGCTCPARIRSPPQPRSCTERSQPRGAATVRQLPEAR